MARVYISIGSNIQPQTHVREAVTALREHYGSLIISSVYESESVGFRGDNFLNLVVGLDTQEDVLTVSARLHDIEDNNGRDRSGPRFSSRTVDLDLLLYDDLIMKDGKLELPRDEITRNAFVLWPLAEIAPQLKHPLTQQSMEELWDSFDKDSQQLWPISMEW